MLKNCWTALDSQVDSARFSAGFWPPRFRNLGRILAAENPRDLGRILAAEIPRNLGRILAAEIRTDLGRILAAEI